MPREDRSGVTHSVSIEGVRGYITANPDADGHLYEVFVHGFGKLGSTMQGWTDSFCIMLSLGLQNGLDIETFSPRLVSMKFPPNGETDNDDIPFCHSVPDYICRWLSQHYGPPGLKENLEELYQSMNAGKPGR